MGKYRNKNWDAATVEDLHSQHKEEYMGMIYSGQIDLDELEDILYRMDKNINQARLTPGVDRDILNDMLMFEAGLKLARSVADGKR